MRESMRATTSLVWRRSWLVVTFFCSTLIPLWSTSRKLSLDKLAEVYSEFWFESNLPSGGNSSNLMTPTRPRRGPSIFFGIKSGAGPAEHDRRRQWRNSTCAQYYAAHDVGFRFMIGRPYEPGHDLTGHNQGAWDTESERRDAAVLMEEAQRYGDMTMLAMRDTYMSLPDKTWNSLEYIWQNHPDNDYMGLHDVEYCANLTVIADLIDKFERESAKPHGDYDFLYSGTNGFLGTEYKSMKGAEGIPRPYVTGWMYFLSRRLVQYIVREDRAHSVLHGVYSSVSEDVSLGKWVAYADERHNVSTIIDCHPMVIEVENMTNQTLLELGIAQN